MNLHPKFTLLLFTFLLHVPYLTRAEELKAPVDQLFALKESREEIKAYMQTVLAYKFAMSFARQMQENGFRDEEIREFTNRPKFQKSIHEIVEDRGVVQAIYSTIDRDLSDESLRARFRSLAAQEETRQRIEVLMAIQTAMREKQLERETAAAQPEESSWDRLWRALRHRLLE